MAISLILSLKAGTRFWNSNQTDYQMKDVWIEFEREVITNAKENAEIELVIAQKKNQLMNILLSAASTLDDENVIDVLSSESFDISH